MTSCVKSFYRQQEATKEVKHFICSLEATACNCEPAPLPGIVRCRSLKMVGVVIADNFSVTQHVVQRLVTSSAQTTYALRVLRCHGLSNTALQLVYWATVVARLTNAASTWRGFTKASDRQHIDSVIDRARRLGYCRPGLPTFHDTAILQTMNYLATLFYDIEPCTAAQATRHRHPSRHNAMISDIVRILQ